MEKERILRFFKAAGKIGGGSVTFAVLLFFFSIEEHLSGRDIPAAWLIFSGCMFFCYGAFKAWSNEHDLYSELINQDSRPNLRVELLGSFFDISKAPNKNDLQVHVYFYLRVTNTGDAETLIRNGNITMTVGGQEHTGTGDDIARKGNAIEHASSFKMGQEVVNADVFGNTFSPFPRLLSKITPENPLRRGMWQEGFFVFTFPDHMEWDTGTPYVIFATDVTLRLTDSFGGVHSEHWTDLQLDEGHLQQSGLFPLSV